MNPVLGWSLAVLAVALAWVQWGWQGVTLAVTMVVFWLLLQFSRVLRVMRQAGRAPVGQVASAVMLHAKLAPGMRLIDILPLANSLGEKVADDPETFVWRDATGASVRVELVDGRCRRWQVVRPPSTASEASGAAAAAASPGADKGAR
jgi:hypothetical protein